MRITMQDSLQEQTEKTEAKENKHKPLLNTSVKFTRGFRGFTKPIFTHHLKSFRAFELQSIVG